MCPSKFTVLTIGHSNRSVEEFLEMLKEHEIRTLVDIRRFPTSKVDHFKRGEMERWLPKHGVEYVWLGAELGGYRRGGYQVHMETELFEEGIEKLLRVAEEGGTCIMCMEESPQYCHRRFVTACLEEKDVKVIHILEKGQVSLMKFER